MLILFFMSMLYVGLEVLPHHYPSTKAKHVELSHSEHKKEGVQAVEPKEQLKRDTMGYSIVSYFLVLSLLLYTKIILQRNHSKEL